ncbi:MAG TPA: MbnP family protein [Chitinophagales bacterium]|nr:MbnP family protein [Chitinophagales bacterium]
MKKNFFYIAIAFILFTSVSSCKKEDTGLTGNGPLTLHFDNRVGNDNFIMNTDVTIESGETINVSNLKYYVSNFVLVKEDGSEYTVPQEGNYFLIDESVDSSLEVTLQNIPAGNYTSIKYILGVDSLRSTMDVSQRTGALDPAGAGSDMYWSWNSGYIFFRIDATSPASTEVGNMCMFHVGGYGGYSTPSANNIRNITLSAPQTIHVRENENPEVHIFADILQAFKSPQVYSIATDGAVFHMAPGSGTKMANNYVDMFTIDHVHE